MAVETDEIGRLKAEVDRLKEENERYRSRYDHIIDHTPFAFYEVDFISARFVNYNSELLSYLGYTREEFESLSPSDILTDESKIKFMERLSRVMEGEEVPDRADYDIVRKDGGTLSVRIFPRYIKKEGNIIGATVVARYLKKEDELKSEIENSEQKYRGLIDNAIEAIFVIQDGKFTFVNRRMMEILGYGESELLDRNFLEFIHPDDRHMVLENHQARLEGGGPDSTYVIRVIKKNGQVGYAEIGGALIPWDGRPATLSFGLDVTDRVIMEKELKRSESKFRSVHDSSPVGIVLSDIKGNILSVNRAFIDFLGWSEKELTEMMIRHIDNPHDHGKEVVLFKEMMEGKRTSYSMEKRFITKDGEEKWGRVVVTIVRGQSPEDDFVIGLALDTDELIRTQKDLQEAKRNAELYLDLMGHDIGNIHQGLLSWLEIARRGSCDPKRINTSVERSTFLVKRCIKLVKNVLLLSRLEKMEKDLRPIDIAGKVERSVDGVKGVFPGSNPVISVERPEGPCLVMAEELIGEIFFNLVHNAIKYQVGDDPMVDISIVRKDDHWVVRFEDRGPGIADNEKDNLFSRHFFEERKMGSGLGLSLCQKLTDRYNGHIHVEDRVPGDRSEGSRFIVELPVHDK